MRSLHVYMCPNPWGSLRGLVYSQLCHTTTVFYVCDDMKRAGSTNESRATISYVKTTRRWSNRAAVLGRVTTIIRTSRIYFSTHRTLVLPPLAWKLLRWYSHSITLGPGHLRLNLDHVNSLLKAKDIPLQLRKIWALYYGWHRAPWPNPSLLL